MAKKSSKGLGRGFESLIPTALVEEEFDPTREEDENISKLVEIEIAKIVRDEEQPRKNFSKSNLEELSASIKEHGILQPIVVMKVGDKYQIVAGERRWRAAQLAGLTKMPAIIRTLNAQNKLELSIIENAQREDLNPIELATAYAKLKTQFNLTNDQIAERVGKSSASVVNTMRLLRLPEEAKKAMQEHNLMEGPMRPLISADKEMVLEVLPRIVDEGWSARRVERYIADKKSKSSAKVVKKSSYTQEESRLCEKYGVEVRVRGRSVTFGAKNEKELRKLLEKF